MRGLFASCKCCALEMKVEAVEVLLFIHRRINLRVASLGHGPVKPGWIKDTVTVSYGTQLQKDHA